MALFQIGLLTVDVYPFNFDTLEHETGSDFAVKEILGAPKPREFVGTADTRFTFKGKLFPGRFGGLTELEACSEMAKSGDPQMVVRGDGFVYGWFLIEKLKHTGTFFTELGLPRQVEVELQLVKSPTSPSADAMISTILGLFS